MPLKLMIDSGAFTVWNSGGSVDLDAYIKFCKERPNLTSIVALDVIPPKGSALTEELKDKVAAEGWSNYLKMIRQLPMEKVIPVFHRGDSFTWLEKMLDFGCPYIGLSPRHDGTGATRRDKFLNESKKYIYDSTGNPITKVHGFAVTNHRMMLDFKWYSVDSAAWVLVGGWGGILVPPLKGEDWDFTKSPIKVACSESGSGRNQDSSHVLAMKERRPELFRIINRWLHEHGIGLGRHVIRDSNGDKPKRIWERWADRSKTKILTIEERGVTNCDQIRYWLNASYFHQVNESLATVPHLFLAGRCGVIGPIERQVRNRLQSYSDDHKKVDWVYDHIGTWDHPFSFPFDYFRK